MKYRRLDKEELQEMETEFVRFLVANTVTGDDWIKIKAEDPERAEKLIELFSDIVFDKILSKAEYMEFKSKNDIKTFHCLPEKIKLLGIFVEGETQLDFTQNYGPEQMLSLLQLSKANLKMYAAEKSYTKERNLELFNMLEGGCRISKGALYQLLENLKD
jgi:hypothetical protein